MPYEIIDIPKEYTYINQVPEFQEDLPDNIYLDKTSTGCGATYAVLTNSTDYVIAVPFISLCENKVDQSESNVGTGIGQYPHKLFMVSGKTLDTEIREYLKESVDTVRKILVTYDSLPRLMSFINPNEFKLFIDEAHKLIEYAGNFKPKVIYDLLESIDSFKSYLLCTATPTKEKYLPEKVKPMRKVKLKWESGRQVNFNHIRLKQNQLRSSILSLCLEYLRCESEGNLYLFYNSVLSVTRICKDLVNSFGYSSSDINVICADNESNIKILKTLGKGFYPRKPVEKDENGIARPNIKKINFITSTAFEGQDFWDENGKTVIVSDGKLDHTKLDISTQVSQIIGRLRNSKYKDTVTMLWTVSPTLGYETIEEYEIYLDQKKINSLQVVSDFNIVQSDTTKGYIVEGIKTDPFLLDNSEGDKLDIILNPDAKNHLLSVYEGAEQQYFVNAQELIDVSKSVEEHVHCTLKDIYLGKVSSNFEIEPLKSSDKLKIGFKGSYSEIASQYVKTLIKLQDKKILPQEIVDSLEEFKSTIESDSRFEVIVEYIKLFGADAELVQGCSRKMAVDYLSKKIEAHKEKVRLKELLSYKYTADQVLSNSSLKEDLTSIYYTLNLTGTPKLTDINLSFETITTSYKEDGKKINAVKLIKKL